VHTLVLGQANSVDQNAAQVLQNRDRDVLDVSGRMWNNKGKEYNESKRKMDGHIKKQKTYGNEKRTIS
jgi:hypothetical protein